MAAREIPRSTTDCSSDRSGSTIVAPSFEFPKAPKLDSGGGIAAEILAEVGLREKSLAECGHHFRQIPSAPSALLSSPTPSIA
jgi:hypothetical protein